MSLLMLACVFVCVRRNEMHLGGSICLDTAAEIRHRALSPHDRACHDVTCDVTFSYKIVVGKGESCVATETPGSFCVRVCATVCLSV